MEQGSFREDLYYRLETFAIHIPALRERDDDLELMAQQFVRQIAMTQGKPVKGFSVAALSLIRSYSFPGNVRELQNVVERAVAFCDSDWIEPQHLPSRLLDALSPVSDGTTQTTDNSDKEQRLLAGNLLPTLDELQQRYVHMVLDEVNGNKRRAAALLGIGRRTLYRWLE